MVNNSSVKCEEAINNEIGSLEYEVNKNVLSFISMKTETHCGEIIHCFTQFACILSIWCISSITKTITYGYSTYHHE